MDNLKVFYCWDIQERISGFRNGIYRYCKEKQAKIKIYYVKLV